MKRQLLFIWIDIRFFLKKFPQAFCKHTIVHGGGGFDYGEHYTTWMCTKCYLQMKEEGVGRGNTSQF